MNVSAAAVTGTGLAKQPEATYTKREPRLLLVTEAGVGTAPLASLLCTRLPRKSNVFDPVSVRSDTGSTANWRQTPEAGPVSARRARSKTGAAWLIPSFTLAGVMRRADARRVAAYGYGVPSFPSGGKNARPRRHSL